MEVLSIKELLDNIAIFLPIHTFNAFARVFMGRESLDIKFQYKWQKHFTVSSSDIDYNIKYMTKLTLNNRLHCIYGPAITYKDGSVEYYENGQLHRNGDLPASIETSCMRNVYYKHGRIHRDNDEPAVVSENLKIYYKDGLRHREYGPAYISPLTEIWYYYGKPHRYDQPAVFNNGDEYYYENGILHRDNDLPAIELANGCKYWYINGEIQRVLIDITKSYIKHGDIDSIDFIDNICGNMTFHNLEERLPFL
jgi:hypothetical protein